MKIHKCVFRTWAFDNIERIRISLFIWLDIIYIFISALTYTLIFVVWVSIIVSNIPAIMYIFSTKPSGKGWNSLQKCHSNLRGVLKLSAQFHFFSRNLHNFLIWYIFAPPAATWGVVHQLYYAIRLKKLSYGKSQIVLSKLVDSR